MLPDASLCLAIGAFGDVTWSSVAAPNQPIMQRFDGLHYSVAGCFQAVNCNDLLDVPPFQISVDVLEAFASLSLPPVLQRQSSDSVEMLRIPGNELFCSLECRGSN